MRLVKKTVNFDDPNSYHLYFGDEQGSPGTLLTFFAWPGTGKGHIGASEPVAIRFQVPKGSLPWWKEQLHGTEVDDRLSLTDPDGMRVELIEGEGTADSPAVQRIHSIQLNLRNLEKSGSLFTKDLQFAQLNDYRYQVGEGAAAGFVDVKASQGGRGVMGAGTIHHVAFRTSDDASQQDWLQHLDSLSLQVSPVMDRKYFHSIYFREPSGVLFEIATDPPGMTVDESAAHLGEGLMLPREYEPARKELEAALTPLHVPIAKAFGEARV